LAIKVTKQQLESIRRHGEQSYPHECCGFLLGTNAGGMNVLKEVYRAENEWQGAGAESLGNRYLITSEQYKSADRYARERGFGIIGYYHSHPDHPAAPSGFDLDHSCWPGESYVIVAVEKGKAAALNSFTKPDYAHFEQEEIVVDE
jgi:proteasome lid subunit RPN8/RPN11